MAAQIMAPIRLMLVEDVEIDAQLTVRALQREGLDPTWRRVETAEQMRAALDDEPWDAVIADYTLPHFSMQSALTLLREYDVDLPFIIVSGTIGEIAAVAAMKAGAHDYHMKGHLARLAVALEREMRDAAERRALRVVEQALRKSEDRLHAQYQELTELKNTLETLLAERTLALGIVEHRALHDVLTELPNRILLYDRLQQALRAAHREDGTVALLLLDLDGFKKVNDTLGHSVGDRLLQQVAARILHGVRESDTAARLGGDEFAILLPREDQEQAEGVSRKLIASINEPFEFEGHRVEVTASIGTAIYPQHGTGVETLMRHADLAMYDAKRKGIGVATYSRGRDQNTKSRLEVIAGLRRAIECDELVLHYQPQLNITDQSVQSVEALVRWQHPERGLLSPDKFIPVAEELGFMYPLTNWVLDAALKQSRAWRDAGIPLNVAINLSASDLTNQVLTSTISERLAAYDLAPHCLTLEITETAVMEQRDTAVARLRALQALGVQISIDDFGVGYSSLAYLAHLPVDELKLDQSFVRGITTKGPERLIVQAVLDLGCNMALRVIAEGVEDDDSLELLTHLGCERVQGYGIARPMPADQVLPWLQGHRVRLAERSRFHLLPLPAGVQLRKPRVRGHSRTGAIRSLKSSVDVTA